MYLTHRDFTVFQFSWTVILPIKTIAAPNGFQSDNIKKISLPKEKWKISFFFEIGIMLRDIFI